MRGGYDPKHYRGPTYQSWLAMKNRCKSKLRMGRYYRARGIGYDPRWEKFSEFLADMGERPSGKTLDRICVDLGYSKDNCRWATPSEQARNKRPYSNTGVKNVYLRTLKNGESAYFICVAPFRSVYARSMERALIVREFLHNARVENLKYRGGNLMFPEQITVTRKVPKEQYGSEEISITATLEEGDDALDCLLRVKSVVYEGLGLKFDLQIPQKHRSAKPAGTISQETAAKIEAAIERPVNEASLQIDAPTGEPVVSSQAEIQQAVVEETAAEEKPKRKRGRQPGTSKIDGKVVTDDEAKVIVEDKKQEAIVAEATKTDKKFKVQGAVYSRELDLHKKIVGDFLNREFPQWKANPAKAKEASLALAGEPFLDGDGLMLESFKAAFREKMK